MAVLTTTEWGRRFWTLLRRRLAWLAAFALLGGARGAPAETAPPDEYQVKAADLYHFAQFVEWPADAFLQRNSPLIIGVLGENPFGSYLDDLVRGEKVGSRPLLVHHYRRPEEIADCHILFVSKSEAGSLDKVFAALKGRSILTVGDVDTFIQQGGLIRFLIEEGTVRFKVNIVVAKASRLTISSKILSRERIETPGKP